MPELAGDTLGEKHRHYNKLVQEAIGNNAIHEDINDDLKELIKIDVANKNKNVDFILKVFQSKDLLYVSRAIKNCTWLVTDNQFAHIINPTYLKEELFPLMTTKASTNLIKHIRNNIKDQTRAELFFLSEDSPIIALKWLPKCSVTFIDSVVHKDDYYDKIKPKLLKKLCERSITILKIVIEKQHLSKKKLKAVSFVRKSNIDLYLDAVDKIPTYEIIVFDSKVTDLIMMHCRDKVIKNFDKYARNMHMLTFSKYLQSEEIKEFLYTQAARVEDHESYKLRSFFTYDNLHHFVKKMPQHEQYDFVKEVFMKKPNNSEGNKDLRSENLELEKMALLRQVYKGNDYDWYQIAPFDVAFVEIKKRINKSTLNQKYSLLTVLIKCAKQNQQHLQTVLNYYCEKHLNDSMNLKNSFVTELLSHTNFCKYEINTWDKFKTMNVYTSSDTDVQKFVESIIVFQLIQNKPIPVVLEEKFAFNNLHKYQYNLEKDVSDRIFDYVFNRISSKVKDHKMVNNKEDLETLVKTTTDLLQLLRDWNKNIADYPNVLEIIRNITQITTKNCWNIDMSPLYDVDKTWRKCLFEESLYLKQSEEVVLNALKRDPKLLTRHGEKVKAICLNKNIKSSKRLLRKVRLYWSQSIAKDWIHHYEMRLRSSSDHDIAIFSLFMLMHQQQCLNFIYKYKPEEDKVDLNKLNKEMFSFQKNIAKNMHFSRPQPHPDAVLLYAKGDYLKYALPSVLAIIYNLNSALSLQYISKLMLAPVSLQKHGIRLAVGKLKLDVLLQLFCECWTKSENATIRATLFKFTLKLLTHKKMEGNVDEIWKLLKMFIDNLTFNEDKSVYDLLDKTSEIPFKIKPSFIETSFTFLQSYLPHLKTDDEKSQLKRRMKNLMKPSREVMEYVNEEFIVKFLKEFVALIFFDYTIEENNYNDDNNMVPIMSAYLLCNREENSQTLKYNDILYPILKRFSCELNNGAIKNNVYYLLRSLCRDLTVYSLKKEMVVPVKLFSYVHEELGKFMEVSQHYVLLRQWELTLELSKMIQKTIANGRTFPDDWIKEEALEPVEVASVCLEVLKKDANERSPYIFLLFGHLLYDTFKNLRNDTLELVIYKHMLSDKEFTPIFMALAKLSSHRPIFNWSEILKIIADHPSLEVKMHHNYYSKRIY